MNRMTKKFAKREELILVILAGLFSCRGWRSITDSQITGNGETSILPHVVQMQT